MAEEWAQDGGGGVRVWGVGGGSEGDFVDETGVLLDFPNK